MTGEELISALESLPVEALDCEVQLEGCDCSAPCVRVEVYNWEPYLVSHADKKPTKVIFLRRS